MSHYSVLVITKPNGKTVDELLAPYDQDIVVAPYIRRTKSEIIRDIIAKDREMQDDYELITKDPVEAEQRFGRWYIRDVLKQEWKVRLAKWSARKYYKLALQSIDKDCLDGAGNEISTYNPNSKWDWYEVGGRWPGLLITKKGTECDSADFTELDIEAMNSATDKQVEDWRAFWNAYVLDKKNVKMSKEVKDRIKFELYKKSYYKDKYKNVATYIKAQKAFSTYAVLLPNGAWVAPGEMGWFGCSSEKSEDSLAWTLNFAKTFLSKEYQDCTFTIVDCHI